MVVCDNCKQAVIAHKVWVNPELNKDYAEWAEYNHSVILPAKAKKSKYKCTVENDVDILEKGFFYDMGEMGYFSLNQFNQDHRNYLDKPTAPFSPRSPTTVATTGMRSAGNICPCLRLLMNTWNGT